MFVAGQCLKVIGRLALVGLLLSFIVESCGAADPPPTVRDVRELMEKQPVSTETWPAWRDYYVRLFYAYEVGEPKEFYEQIRGFIYGIASGNGGTLPGEWADDPLAWIILSYQVRRSGPDAFEQSEEDSRRALALGDPAGMSSFNLARTLIAFVARRNKPGELTPESREKVAEAERLLRVVEQTAPEARLSFDRGMIAWTRGEKAAAFPLLRQGAADHPYQSACAEVYLKIWLFSEEAERPFVDTSEPFVKQFPDDAPIRALHAVALYRDERFPEAYETLQRARRLDETDLQLLGAKTIKAIEEGRWLTSMVLNGLKVSEKKRHTDAATKFREALEQDPLNVVAARLLVRSLLAGSNDYRDTPNLRKIVNECAQLSQRFPTEAELQIGHAAALIRAGRSVEAAEALTRAESLGGDVDAIAGRGTATRIREAAQADARERVFQLGVISGVGVYAAWLAVMFAIGGLLAVCTSRIPDTSAVFQEGVTAGDIWRDRFYVFILGLSLLMFYLSVPFVALGLLAITLLLFGLMLVVRILHIGILERGFYATWGVIRSTFLGPSRNVVGVVAAEEQHPQLLTTLHEVANRLNTNPVDTVYLTPSSHICVREDGTGPFGLFRRRRVMEIGISTLSQLTTTEFKSILAHEFGHFTRQDPFYARFISQVTASLAYSLAVMNAAGGVMNYVNPFYWFYWLYLRAYALLAAGFSRSREFLADRRAVLAYGKEAFIAGLTKVSVEGTLFEGTSAHIIKAQLGAGRAFVNVFDAFRQFRDQPELADTRRKILEGIRESKPRWFDSHPTYSERLAAVNGFPESREIPDTVVATSLLSEITTIEEQLTNLFTGYIYQNCEISDQPD